MPIGGTGVEFLSDAHGYVGGRFSINGGIHAERGVFRRQVLVSVEIYVRDINCTGCSSDSLLESVGEYLLALKALHDVGLDRAAWRKLMQSVPWIVR